MNSRRREMWKASRWNHYNDFRVFIMGVKGNEELFGDGVIYEGVWDEPKRVIFFKMLNHNINFFLMQL